LTHQRIKVAPTKSNLILLKKRSIQDHPSLPKQHHLHPIRPRRRRAQHPVPDRGAALEPPQL